MDGLPNAPVGGLSHTLVRTAVASEEVADGGLSGLNWATFSVAAAGLLVAFFGLWYAGRQLRQARLSAAASLLLQLDDAFARHRDVHLKLRPGGDWAGSSEHPNSAELPPVEEYMGLFERIEVMLESDMLDTSVVDRLYGYRVANILDNHPIRVTKLIERSKGWRDFLLLVERLEATGRKFHDGATCPVPGCKSLPRAQPPTQ